MRGSFEKIVGKTISGVYCRENERNPQWQIFLLFDDGVYFEIYADGLLRGPGGVDKGALEEVLNLNQSPGAREVM